MRGKIYVAGPYSKGDKEKNVHEAIRVANALADLGFAPYVPHFTHYWDIRHNRPYEFWLELDNQFLPCCDAVLRIPGESSGADKEVVLAQKVGLPIFTNIDELVAHYDRTEADHGA
jgi:Domain of unknown function (DUF4406)